MAVGVIFNLDGKKIPLQNLKADVSTKTAFSGGALKMTVTMEFTVTGVTEVATEPATALDPLATTAFLRYLQDTTGNAEMQSDFIQGTHHITLEDGNPGGSASFNKILLEFDISGKKIGGAGRMLHAPDRKQASRDQGGETQY